MIDKIMKDLLFCLFAYFSIAYFVEYALSEKNIISCFILIVCLISSFVNFIIYDIDRLKAKYGKKRIDEKALIKWGLCGGGCGGIIAMVLLKHKINNGILWLVNIIGIILPVVITAFAKGDLS